MVDWDFSGVGAKAPTLRPEREPVTPGVSKVQAVKALRAEFPNLGLKEAVDIVDGKAARPDDPEVQLIELTDTERRVAVKALSRVTLNPDAKVDLIVDAINKVRTSDPEGTVRKSVAGQYAFAVSPGTYLIIETGDNPRYKSASEPEARDIKRFWSRVTPASFMSRGG
ncbi:hypothetical protein [Mycolicibacterium sphagni]|uniref:Uncharacterized protein n=1 Tax=Mycolicibacterium sphagni TaxID=1786 RepID=A0A255DRM7_9MYCO|nr:hypothetical protein [Mycolicibacterium sphagni]OYN81740.1 hypothetical protein CG716_05135 [Mycolicibacterium sphagni]